MAYADYSDLMDLTNLMFSQLVTENNFNPRAGSTELDFTASYARLEFLPGLEKALDCRLPDPSQLEDEDSLK